MPALLKAIERGFSIYETPPPLTLNEDANTHFCIVKGDTKEGDWESLPNQIAPLNWMGNDDIKIITWKKSARVGATKCACAAWQYFTRKNRDQLIYQPTVDDAAKFKKDELNGLLLHIKPLNDICKGDPEKKSSAFTADRMTFRGSTTDVLGGKTPRNFRRMTKDVVIYDELSGFDEDIGGEGSAVKLGDMRLATSSFKKSIRLSTPKIKDSCQISTSLKSADVIMHRWVPCPHCGHYQVLRWRDPETKLYRFDIETAKYLCENGCMFGYHHLPEIDKKGQWRSDDGAIIYDEQKDQFFLDGEEMDFPRHVGLHIWAAYSYYQTWTELVAEFKEATDTLAETGDTTLLKSFINTQLGEEWEDRGERVENVKFEGDRLDVIAETIPNDILCLTMWADVQGGKNARVEYEVVGWGEKNESWSLEYKEVLGDIESEEVWDHVDAARAKIWTREDGVTLRVAQCGVDSGYKPDIVYKYTGPRQRQKVIATKGHSQRNKAVWDGKVHMEGPKKNVQLIMIGTDTAKDILFTRLNKTTEPGPGYCHFPAHYEQNYFDMLTAEEKKKTRNKKTGRSSYEWVKIRERNEALDCRVGNMAMIAKLNPNFHRLKLRIEKQAAQKTESPQKEDTGMQNLVGQKPKKRIAQRRKGGFVNGWR